MAKATFGAGCFWGVESAFRQVKGVTDAAVGYMGGTLANPTYQDVCTDRTGHAESESAQGVVVTKDERLGEQAANHILAFIGILVAAPAVGRAVVNADGIAKRIGEVTVVNGSAQIVVGRELGGKAGLDEVQVSR